MFETPGSGTDGMDSRSVQGGGIGTNTTAAMGTDPWMQEIDTAIDGYDVYVDRLTNATVGGEGTMAGWGGPQDGYNNGSSVPGQGAPGWGMGGDMPNGMQDWDWGLML